MLLTAKETAGLLRVTVSTLYRWRSLGRFPEPIRLSPGAVAWQSEAVQSWLAERHPGATLDPARVAGTAPRGKGGRRRKATR